MSNTYFQLYLNDIYRFLETIVIKSHTSAIKINEKLTWMGVPVNREDPRSWKYYLHLSGQYHHTDKEMVVTSIDTLEPILFSVNNLKIHRATRREYLYGSHYYDELLTRFPDQEQLIKGILNPIDIDKAINAADHSILYYDESLVESNEYTLIRDLQRWIDAFVTRWDNQGYALTDDLYHPAFLGVMYLNLPSAMLNLRDDRCNTEEAHSFHVREYLASNGRLDRYLPFMTKKQALFLYRNIRYIQRNAGRASTLELLIEKIMTDRGLPIASYEIKQNHLEHTLNHYAKPDLVRSALNFKEAEAEDDHFTVREVLEKERSLARRNSELIDDHEVEINQALKVSTLDTLPTKLLESAVVDKSDASPYPLTDVLLHHWLYLSANKRYQTVVSVPNPKTGIRMALKAKDAFIVFIYAFNAAHGIRLETIPRLEAVGVRRLEQVTEENLRAVIESDYVPDSVVERAMSNQPMIGIQVSVESFYETCLDIQSAMMEHRWLYTQQEHYVSRGQVERMIQCYYQTIECDVGAGEFYEQWFAERALNIGELSVMECGILARDLLKHATGQGLGTAKTLREIQEAMLRLMGELSSYSIQFLKSINSEAVQLQEWAAVRCGDHRGKGFHQWLVDGAPVRVLNHRAKGEGNLRIEVSEGGFNFTPRIIPKHKVFLDPTIDHWTTDAKVIHRHRVEVAMTDVLAIRGDQPIEDSPIDIGQL